MITKKDVYKFIDIAQMDALNKSVKELTENIQALNRQTTNSFTQMITNMQTFTQEIGKANKYFERMDRSATATERLTMVMTVLTAYLFGMTFYPIFKNDLGLDIGWSIISAIGVALCAVIGINWGLNIKIQKKTEKQEDKK